MTSRWLSAPRWARTGVALGAALLLIAGRAAGQSGLEALLTECIGSSTLTTTVIVPCTDAVHALQAASAAVGLALSGGNDLPGSASTLGRRIGSVPRVSITMRVMATSVESPGLELETTGTVRDGTILGAQISLTASLFNGFAPAPTVSGILALDVHGTLGVTSLPGSVVPDGGGNNYGVGARMGIVRESFTLPGVSVSVGLSGMGKVRVGELARLGDSGVDFSPSTRFVRGVIGKDLLGIGVSFGTGWDWHTGDATIQIRTLPGGRTVSTNDIDSRRRVYFGSAAMTFLVFQLSAEVGLADGFDPIGEGGTAGFDPGERSWWVSVAGRLTY